jgi:hypothetical protein
MQTVAEPLEALGVPWHLQSFLILIFFFAIFLPKFHMVLPKKKMKQMFISLLLIQVTT